MGNLLLRGLPGAVGTLQSSTFFPYFLISSSLSTGKEMSLHHSIRLCRRNKAELSNAVTQTRTALHSARAVL